MGRTFAIGDIHGDLDALNLLLSRLPELTSDDTLVFLGDYIDSGPDSKGVCERLMALPGTVPAKIVWLRGNHEDAWLKVMDEGWPGFVMPKGNGCHAAMRSFRGMAEDDEIDQEAFHALFSGSFFPPEVVAWMAAMPSWYEDDHAIYVHAGLVQKNGVWLHPSEVEDPTGMLWTRADEFFLKYAGKTVVVGHTGTNTLPEGESLYTPDDNDDLYWAGRSAYCIDTGCGKSGFLTALQLPERLVYESRN